MAALLQASTIMIGKPIHVAVVGGGIGGLAAGNALHQRGINVRVYEQAAALTEVGAGVALQPNGVRMLRRLGFGDELLRLGARWHDPQFLRADGSYAASMWPADLAGQIEFYGMHRADLLAMLAARLPPGIIATGQKCVGFEQDDTRAVLIFARIFSILERNTHARRIEQTGGQGIHANFQE